MRPRTAVDQYRSGPEFPGVLHAGHPIGKSLRVGSQSQHLRGDGSSGLRNSDVAKRDGQDAAFAQLENAKGTRELHKWWIDVDLHCEWKARCVLQGAAGVVDDSTW